jgi:hypothetical protein
MKCPHCLTEFHDGREDVFLGKDKDGEWVVFKRVCPACKRMVLSLALVKSALRSSGGPSVVQHVFDEYLVRPKAANRPPPPAEVPQAFAEDYKEACSVIGDSPKASAALSRRCLQHILREVAKIRPGNLADEIQQVIDSEKLPSHIVESIDAVRNTGNFAAHPMNSTASGEVLPVEPGEAEWNLDVLEALFDFYFVQPALLKKKRDALNLKLQEAGKPPMK